MGLQARGSFNYLIYTSTGFTCALYVFMLFGVYVTLTRFELMLFDGGFAVTGWGLTGPRSRSLSRDIERLAEYGWKPPRMSAAQIKLSRASIYRCMRDKQWGMVSSSSRFQTVLFQKYSANLSDMDPCAECTYCPMIGYRTTRWWVAFRCGMQHRVTCHDGASEHVACACGCAPPPRLQMFIPWGMVSYSGPRARAKVGGGRQDRDLSGKHRSDLSVCPHWGLCRGI